MSIFVVQSDDLEYDSVQLYPLPASIWERACELANKFRSGTKIVFYSMKTDFLRHDFMVEKINKEQFKYYYLIANETDYSIYEWDTSIRHL